MRPVPSAAIGGALAALGYLALSAAFFTPPQTLADGEACGFGPGDFGSDGQLLHTPWSAWALSFVRQQELFSLLSVSLALAFVVYALRVLPRRTDGVAVGAAAGGGVLALSALCVSCLAPVLSAVGLGVAGSWLIGVPKWLIAFNTLLLTGWGALHLSRRAAVACPLPADRLGATASSPSNP